MIREHFWLLVRHVVRLEVSTPSLQVKNRTNEKLNSSSWTFRKMRSQGKPLPKKLNRQTDTENHNLLEHNPWVETSMWISIGVGNLNCNWWIVGDSLQTTLKSKYLQKRFLYFIHICIIFTFLYFTFWRSISSS